jgi:hypothetical protein
VTVNLHFPQEYYINYYKFIFHASLDFAE